MRQRKRHDVGMHLYHRADSFNKNRHLSPPRTAFWNHQVHIGHEKVHDEFFKMLSVSHVPVERHGRYPEFASNVTHGERAKPLAVDH